MRTALIYSGQLRSWEQCKGNHYDNIWADNDCDLYFYTDKNPLMGMEKREIEYCESKKWKFTQDENVDWYPDPFKYHRYFERMAIENTYCQTLRQWHCGFIGFNLVPKGYDCYVRIRPDIIFNSKIKFSLHDLEGKKIYIPQGNDFYGINDQFAFGSHETMKIFYSVYQNHHDLWHDGVLMCSEVMQQQNLIRNGVNIERISQSQNIVR